MPIPKEERYTFADILNWDIDARIELIDGMPYMMAPPTTEHQRILMELSYQLRAFLEGKKCQVFPAPFGVRLFSKKEDRPEDETGLLEPDITVVCDPGKLDKHGCKGAPDFIVEIISPSSQRRDRLEKYNLYQMAGVREYWIVDPERKLVQAVALEDGRYPLPQVYTATDKAPVSVLEGCVIDLGPVLTGGIENA